MKNIFSSGTKLFFKVMVLNIVCFFIVISFAAFARVLFTEDIGYVAYGTTVENAEPEKLYTFYFDDGEDLKMAEFEKQGYKIGTSLIRSRISGMGNVIFLIVSEFFCLSILIATIYYEFSKRGTQDSNLVKFNHKTEDKLLGFKIGVVATIPNYLMLVFLLVSRFGIYPDFPMAIYKFLNSSVYSFIDIIASGPVTVASLPLWRLLLLFILPVIIPIISGISYLMGYKNILIGERLLYKKKVK